MGLAGFQAAAPLIGAVVGPTLSALFAPDGQELSSFEGHYGVDPVTQLQNVNALINRLGRGVSDRAASPVSLPSSYVQQTPVISGGGLPMPIGLTGSDPALANPSLLNLQGMGEFQNLFSGLDGGASRFGVPTGPGVSTPPGGGVQPGAGDGEDFYGTNNNIDTGAFDDFYLPSFDQRTEQNRQGTTDGAAPRQDNAAESVTRRRPYGQLVRGNDLLQQPDDMDRAEAAVKLLLQNL